MVVYKVEQSKIRLQKRFSELMTELVRHKKLSRENRYPVRILAVIMSKLVRIGKQFGYEGERKRPEVKMKIVSQAWEIFGIETGELIELKLTTEGIIRKALIKHEAERMRKEGIKLKDITMLLGKKYKASPSAVEKIIYRK